MDRRNHGPGIRRMWHENVYWNRDCDMWCERRGRKWIDKYHLRRLILAKQKVLNPHCARFDLLTSFVKFGSKTCFHRWITCDWGLSGKWKAIMGQSISEPWPYNRALSKISLSTDHFWSVERESPRWVRVQAERSKLSQFCNVPNVLFPIVDINSVEYEPYNVVLWNNDLAVSNAKWTVFWQGCWKRTNMEGFGEPWDSSSD
jgi:hypothetical protein